MERGRDPQHRRHRRALLRHGFDWTVPGNCGRCDGDFSRAFRMVSGVKYRIGAWSFRMSKDAEWLRPYSASSLNRPTYCAIVVCFLPNKFILGLTDFSITLN